MRRTRHPTQSWGLLALLGPGAGREPGMLASEGCGRVPSPPPPSALVAAQGRRVRRAGHVGPSLARGRDATSKDGKCLTQAGILSTLGA